MESEQASIKIEKLHDSNFHIWKVKIRMVLSIRELDHYLDDDNPPTRTDPNYSDWLKKDKKARAFIGLSLSNNQFEQVQHASSARDMWKGVCDIFEKHTLLNLLAARRKFYTTTMKENEKVLEFSARVRQHASTLKSMGVEVGDDDMAMTLLSGLTSRYDGLISALDAISDDQEKFTYQFVVSRCQQEEQRHLQRDMEVMSKSETAALIARKTKPRGDCVHCGKHNNSNKCWKKFPHLAPEGHPYRTSHKALVSSNAPSAEIEEDEEVCLLGSTHLKPDKFKSLRKREWILDSGCSAHLTYDRDSFLNFTPVSSKSVDLGAGSSTSIVGTGDVSITILVSKKRKKCTIRNVMYVPALRYQLLSISVLAKAGISAQFDNQGVRLLRNGDGKIVATGSISESGLYILDVVPNSESSEISLSATLSVWHQRLGHVSQNAIKSMAKNNVVNGLQLTSNLVLPCSGCILGKSHRSTIPKVSQSRSSRLLELIHSDLMGPFEEKTLGGSRYLITFIDDFSKWTVAYTMKTKSEALHYFKHYKSLAEVHNAHKIHNLQISTIQQASDDYLNDSRLKILRSDNGGEYLSSEFKRFLAEEGVRHELTVPYTPQQNGVAERMNRTILDLARSMLYHKNLPKYFWGEACATAVYIRNRVTTASLPSKITPHHRWNGEPPDVSHLRTFGAKCYYVLPKKHIKKLDARARKAIMVGYSNQSKGYKIFDLQSHQFIVSRDVRFLEDETNESFTESEEVCFDEVNEQSETNDSEPEATDEEAPQTPLTVSTASHCELPSERTQPSLRRSSRKTKPPGEWWKVTSTNVNSETALFADCEPPQSYSEATSPENIDFWLPGIQKEENSIRENGTFTLVKRTSGMNVIPCKYVFRVKNGAPKVRIVAKGFRQVEGIDYQETYAPVVGMSTVRCFLALVAHFDLECDQMDVVTAFLNGDLEETIYMEVPAGFSDPNNPNLVCLLRKALYGLKQAPRQWYAKINCFLLDEMEFKSCSYEPCLYFKIDSGCLILIILYVDDLLIAGSNSNAVDLVKQEFSKRYKMKDLGSAQEFLGISIFRNRLIKNLSIGQFNYIDRVLDRFNMSGAKSSPTPMAGHAIFEEMQEENVLTNIPYRPAIGSLMYLATGTRPDISFAVGKLAQYCEKPTLSHWTAVKRILRYIKGTRDLCITYKADNSLDVRGYCDSDWAGCRATRRSTGGFLFTMCGGPITWRSKKQRVVATSTCEAEYIAAYDGVKEAVWLSSLLLQITGVRSFVPIKLFIDNQGSIDMASSNAVNARNKHIDIRYHYVRDAVSQKRVQLEYIPNQLQVADPLTKALSRDLFTEFREMMGLRPMANQDDSVKGAC